MSAVPEFDALIDFAAGKSEAPGRAPRPFVPLFGGDEAAAPEFDETPLVPGAEPEAPASVDLPEVAAAQEAESAGDAQSPTPSPQDTGAPKPAPEPSPDHAALTARIEELEAGIVSLNERHLAEMTGRVAEAIAGLGQRVSADVSSELALVLEQALLTQAQAETVSRFAAELGQLISVGGAARVTVTGPEPLLDALRASWAGPAPLPELIAGDGLDLVARVDDALLAARMEGLREALCGGEV